MRSDLQSKGWAVSTDSEGNTVATHSKQEREQPVPGSVFNASTISALSDAVLALEQSPLLTRTEEGTHK